MFSTFLIEIGMKITFRFIFDQKINRINFIHLLETYVIFENLYESIVLLFFCNLLILMLATFLRTYLADESIIFMNDKYINDLYYAYYETILTYFL